MRHVKVKCVMSHVNTSFHTWMSQVTHAWDMTHKKNHVYMNDSCHVWKSLIALQYVVSHTNESCHKWVDHVIYKRVMSHINAICSICRGKLEWVMSHTNDLRHTWKSRATYQRVTSHMNESCHIWVSHVTYEWVMWCSTHWECSYCKEGITKHTSILRRRQFRNSMNRSKSTAHSLLQLSRSCKQLAKHYCWTMAMRQR